MGQLRFLRVLPDGSQSMCCCFQFHEKMPGSALIEVTLPSMWAETRRQPAQSGFQPARVPPPQALVQLLTVLTTRATEALTPVLSLACKQSKSLISTIMFPCGPLPVQSHLPSNCFHKSPKTHWIMPSEGHADKRQQPCPPLDLDKDIELGPCCFLGQEHYSLAESP